MDLNDIIMDYDIRSETDSLNKSRLLREVQAEIWEVLSNEEQIRSDCGDYAFKKYGYTELFANLRRLAGTMEGEK